VAVPVFVQSLWIVYRDQFCGCHLPRRLRQSAHHPTQGLQRHCHTRERLDRLERRAGRWAIARRVCVVEWISSLAGESEVDPQMREAVAALMRNSRSSRDRNDISYQRPLEIREAGTA